jgi:tetratricopeptide (TPR) repeat protein
MKTFNIVLFTCLSCILCAQDFNNLIETGDKYFNVKDYTTAVTYFSQAIKADSLQVKGYWYRGDAYFYSKKYPEALSDYKRIVKMNPGNARFFGKLGDTWYNMDYFSEALTCYDSCIILDSKNGTYWFYRGDCYKKLNNNEHACSDYEKAYQLGEKTARNQAKLIGCKWVSKIEMQELCSTEEPKISKISIDAFTGAILICKGFTFEEFKVEPLNTGGFLTHFNLDILQQYKFSIKNPIGLCPDKDTNVFPGTGFIIMDDKNAKIMDVEDLYKNNDISVSKIDLSSLSLKIKCVGLVVDKDYFLKINFFDHRSKNQLIVNFPFKLVKNSYTSNSIYSTKGSLGKNIESKSNQIEIKSFKIFDKGNPAELQLFELNNKKVYTAVFDLSTNLTGIQNYEIRFINQQGEIASKLNGKANVLNHKLNIDFKNDQLLPGEYIMWIKSWDDSGKLLGLTVPVTIK